MRGRSTGSRRQAETLPGFSERMGTGERPIHPGLLKNNSFPLSIFVGRDDYRVNEPVR